jgi:DNA replication and repair protein RecF
MLLSSLTLTKFRNHAKRHIDFVPTSTVIVGANASGKTNILEAIFMLATGKSFKARVEEEMVQMDADIGRVKADISTEYLAGSSQQNTSYKILPTNLEVVLTRGYVDFGTSMPTRTPRKKLLVNGVSKRLVDFAGLLPVVLFGPWDMDLVTDSPSTRRKFLDTVLSQSDREYRRCLIAYEKGVRQRNKLLIRIREEGISRSQLVFWNQLLLRNGEYITRKREEFIGFVNTSSQLLTTSSKGGSASGGNYQLLYDRSAITEARLEQYKVQEVAAGTTLVGPHRDDFSFEIKNAKVERRNLETYGSRGEQRMGILWLKLAELTYIKKSVGTDPVLLLDDIFSELDHDHRDVVMAVIDKQQTILTTADPHYVEGMSIGKRIEL